MHLDQAPGDRRTESKDDAATEFSETDGNKSRDITLPVGTMENGDKYHITTQGTHTMRDRKYEIGEGTWSFAGVTSKLKGIKGKGTYKCKPSGDNVDCDVEGEYTLPTK